MFSIAIKKNFWWPVTVMTPDPDQPGAFVASEFQARFEAVSTEEAGMIDAAVRERPGYDQAVNGDDYIMEITHDWRDVVDDRGQPAGFTREQLAALMRFSWFRQGMVAAYRQAMSGQAARLGN